MDRADILLRGGLVFDGSGREPFVADVSVKGERIAAIGQAGTARAETVIDARGLAVAPGFIDTHAHSDFTILADPRAEGKICQGVTTEVNGNCGMSAAPLMGQVSERREEDLRELGVRERWHTFQEYFSLVEKAGSAINLATLAGHGNLRGSVMGYEDRAPDGSEMSKMSSLLEESVKEGAIGLSTGLIYPPGVYSGTGELTGLARVLREGDLIYTSHMRSEGDALLEAVLETARIGREAGVKAHISHIKTAGRANWPKAEEVISTLRQMREDGVRVTCDRYPYVASSTELDALLPSWTYAGGNDEELRRLSDGKERERIAAELREQASSPDYWDGVIISSVVSEENRWMEGKTVSAIGRRLGLGEIDAVFRLLLEEKLRVGAIFLSMSEENLAKFLSLPFCMIGSDSSARSFDGPTRRGKPHPRTFGTFPRFLGRYARDAGIISFAEAVRRATGLAAGTFGLRGRGLIREGMYADLVVFDQAKLLDRATFEEPFQRPDGIAYVVVNGVIALSGGTCTGALAGRVLRGGG